MMLVNLLCFCLAAQWALGLPSLKETYHGHKVLKILHKTEEDFRKLLNMELKYELDFWKMPKHLNDTLTVRVGPQHLQAFLSELESLNTYVSTMIEDVQELLDTKGSSTHRHFRRASPRARMDFNSYYTTLGITTFLKGLNGVNVNGVTATWASLGLSYEGRDIDIIKLSTGTTPKRAIFIDGGIHAREWVAPATVLYVLDQLLYNPDNRQDVKDVLAKYDFFLVPLVNPDGYDHSGYHNRMWRKNRRFIKGNCVGVDLNRNFPFEWNPDIGGSHNPCHDTYSGSNPASEVETQAITNFLLHGGHDIAAYLTIHSYGQMWLYPWGYTSALPADSADLKHAADIAVAALSTSSGTSYAVGSSTNVLYAAAGGSDDFAKGGAGIKYAYTIELRDKGVHGFLLPEELIVPTASEFFDGLLAFSMVI